MQMGEEVESNLVSSVTDWMLAPYVTGDHLKSGRVYLTFRRSDLEHFMRVARVGTGSPSDRDTREEHAQLLITVHLRTYHRPLV